MTRLRTTFTGFKRSILLTIEVIAAVGALFAFYEIFFARKTVDFASYSFDLCGPLTEQHTDFSEFLAKNADNFIYLQLDVTQRPLQCPIQGHEPLFSDVDFQSASVILEVNDGGEQGYQRVPEFDLWGFTTYLYFEPADLRDQILGDVSGEWAEDPGFIGIEGIFFVKPAAGEGDIYFSLIPPPFDVQTEQLSRCTSIVNSTAGWTRIRRYFDKCVLS